ncbi:MAG: leucine-rich repeat protein [Lachnospiraceae bacterium]|nr:leucine-rich repeat protein [Lachnospiraceae bacterium]
MSKKTYINKKMRKMIVTVIAAAMLFTAAASSAGCAGCNKEEAFSPTRMPTATEKPAEATEVPTELPTEMPTVTLPATKAPTKAPSLVPSPTPTVAPTATPVPTPTPVIPEGVTPIASVKMGDDVYYDFYGDGTLVVRGTGATYGFPEYTERQLFIINHIKLNDSSYAVDDFYDAGAIIIEEGITEIGDNAFSAYLKAELVSFPSTLKKIGNMAFYWTGYGRDTQWLGLDTGKVEIAGTAFLECGGQTNIEDFGKYSSTPTPTPTLTPTPTPNPDKPRKITSLSVGANIYYEFWDNGVMYVKGSGAISNQSELFSLWEAYDNPNAYMIADSLHTVIIEEGITSIGRYALNGLRKTEEWYLPKSFVRADEYCGGAVTTIHGYYNGKAVTVKEGSVNIHLSDFYKVLEDADYAEEVGATILWE